MMIQKGAFKYKLVISEHLEQNSFFISLYSNFPLVFPHPNVQKDDTLATHSLCNTIYGTISLHRSTLLHCKAITRLRCWQIQHLPPAVDPMSCNSTCSNTSFQLPEMHASILHFVLSVSNLTL